MANLRSTAATCALGALLLAGCDGDLQSGAVWPTLDGTAPSGETASAPTAGTFEDGAEVTASAGADPFAPAPAPVAAPIATTPTTVGGFSTTALSSQPTGSHVGLRVTRLQQDLARLQNNATLARQRYEVLRPQFETHAQAYQQSVAPIYSRLQIGTTPGNPQLVQMWNESGLQLNRLNDDVDQLNALGNEVAADAALGSFLLESVRASYGLSGAYEQDHRNLAVLEDETNRTVLAVDRLLSDISTDINRQGNYVANEQANLTALALAIKTGSFYDSPIAGASGVSGIGGTPSAVIRFDRNNPNYQSELRALVGGALQRNPNAAFDLVAVSAGAGSTAGARQKAEQVYASMARMGVDADRVNLSATSGNSGVDEVHIYVR